MSGVDNLGPRAKASNQQLVARYASLSRYCKLVCCPLVCPSHPGGAFSTCARSDHLRQSNAKVEKVLETGGQEAINEPMMLALVT